MSHSRHMHASLTFVIFNLSGLVIYSLWREAHTKHTHITEYYCKSVCKCDFLSYTGVIKVYEEGFSSYIL